MEVAMGDRDREYLLDVYKLVLGFFVFLAPWLFALSYGPARIESVISGAAAACERRATHDSRGSDVAVDPPLVSEAV